ncbi:MAG: acetyl-CoA carboxylase carboxyl transferase subunit beta [Chloroflexi bacterium]|nr:acetyl-CoA carboxylase carboxyl transferase subunit beta [Chloroflexota bacterium]
MSSVPPIFSEDHEYGLDELTEKMSIELEGLRSECIVCGANLTQSSLYKRLQVCPRCRYHYSISARRQITALADEGTFNETSTWIQSLDPLEFSPRASYRVRLIQDQNRTGLTEAAITGTCAIGGTEIVIIVLDFGFLGGSMGLVVGEKVALALELAARKKLPALDLITSGGTRIQEGVLSLMQMAKTVIAVNALHKKGMPLITVLGNPATGQVLGSFASLADLIFAEPGAHIGFAPFREIQEAEDRRIENDQYSSETYFHAGLIDRVIDREHLKHELASVLDLISPEFKLSSSRKAQPTQPELTPREPWEMVQLARRPDRPRARFYIENIFENFVELHGDRISGQDSSVVFGLARMGGESVMVIGQEKSRQMTRNDHGDVRGDIKPEGFRQATRAMQIAERFRLPVITIVDTPGPRLGLEQEHRGLAIAMANTIDTMSRVDVPTISVLIGEGGSEAALPFSVADRVLMMQNSIYTPISPEQGARFELRDSDRARDIARALRLTSADCLQMGIIDDVVAEPAEGAHASPDEAARLLKRTLMRELVDLRKVHRRTLVRRRQKKFRNIGEYGNRYRSAVSGELNSWRAAFHAGVRALRKRGPGADAADVQDKAEVHAEGADD